MLVDSKTAYNATGQASAATGILGADAPLLAVSSARNDGLVDDGIKTYCAASWQQGGHGFCLSAITVRISVSQSEQADGTTSSEIAFHSAVARGAGPDAGWIGKPIAIKSGEAIIVSRVVDFRYDSAQNFLPTLILEETLPDHLNGAECCIACPCFVTCDVGKSIWISNAGGLPNGHGNPVAAIPFRSNIVGVVTPWSIELADAVGATSQADQPGCLVVWGTDNSAVVRSIGRQAMAAGITTLSFVGSGTPAATRVFCLFDWVPNHGHASAEEIDGSSVMSAMQWVSINCELIILSACGRRGNEASGGFQDTSFRKSAVPWNAAAAPAPPRGVIARQHFPRCATLDEIVVVVTGDSWAAANPGHAANDHSLPIIRELIRQNPAKRIRVFNRAIGGGSWMWLNSRLPSGGSRPAWYADPACGWLSYVETIALANGEVVRPDLVLLLMTGNNDAAPSGMLHRNDVAAVVARIRRWPRVNGLPPDIAMMCGGAKGIEMFAPIGEASFLAAEYATSLLRSFARNNRIGLFDLGTAMGLLIDGWAPDHLVLRQVPPLLAGPAAPELPYSARYLCRDFYLAIRLGARNETAAAFWAGNRNISVALSAKGDNRLWLGPDQNGDLQVCVVAWGMPVVTEYDVAARSRQLVTLNQECLPFERRTVTCGAPGFGIGGTDLFRPDMVGKCLLVPSVGYQGGAYRTYVQGFTNRHVIFCCDGNATWNPAETLHVGGQMFIASDAAANADCVVGGAGDDHHLLTGAASLVTRCATDGFVDHHSVTLERPAASSAQGGSGTVFLGAIAQQPSYDVPVQVADDQATGAIITVRVQGTRARIGYVHGGHDDEEVRLRVRNHEAVVWEGEIERMGAPFVPKIWSAGASTLQVVDMWAGEKELFMPQLTHREVWGLGDPAFSGRTGGDGSHMSHLGINRIIGRVASAQDLAIGVAVPGSRRSP